jgi:hypothetical protein
MQLQNCPQRNCYSERRPLVKKRKKGDGYEFSVACPDCGLTAQPAPRRDEALANWNDDMFLTATIRREEEYRLPEMVRQPGNW